ncbi:putative methionyl-tRNA synthetase [Hordeum vulgare]|nr:putative methionyl-tRNA synthetase [Hordeum vulgare]
MMNPPGRNPHDAWRGRQGVASPVNLSTSMPPLGVRTLTWLLRRQHAWRFQSQQHLPAWRAATFLPHRLALDKAKETYNLDVPAPIAAEGRPDGTKKVRAARDAAPAAERQQASIEQCIAEVKSSATRREEKSDARWSALMINVAAKKRNTNVEFLMGADTSTMNEKVKARYIVQRDLILSQMPALAATTAAITTAAQRRPARA